jgi:5-methylcytosine-specific restriction protein A
MFSEEVPAPRSFGKVANYVPSKDGHRRVERFKGTRKARGYGNDWHRLRNWVLEGEPLCRRCVLEGRTVPAQEVHHIVAIKDNPDLRLSQDNLMPVCRSCHRLIEAGK